jgi:DNA polymerase-3 subunit delta'
VTYLTKVVEGTYTSPLLLIGDEGVGKRFSVLQAITQSASRGNSEDSVALQISSGAHPDVFVVGPEGGKDIGIEAVRDVLSRAVTYPMVAPYKYLVVDGVDRLTIPAANAILKTLEEPPEKTRFFLLAESLHRVIPTIRSRCGRVRYKHLSEKFIQESIRDFVPDLTKALVYTRLAEGSLGRALYYFGSSRLGLRDRSFGLIKAGLGGDLSSVFSAVSTIGKDDLGLALRFLEHLLYDMTILPHTPDRIANLDLRDELVLVRSKLGESRLRRLQRGLYELLQRSKQTSITLEFHVKTYLALAFSE